MSDPQLPSDQEHRPDPAHAASGPAAGDDAGAAGVPSPAETAAPDEAAAPATPAVDRRPRPAYGEYAPEGWEWKPTEPASAPAPAGQGRPGADRLEGVPHNLGVGGSRGSSGKSGASDSRRNPQPYRDQPQQPARLPHDGEDRPSAGPLKPPAFQGPVRSQRTGDRVVTILLLVLGAFGVLQLGSAMFALRDMVFQGADLLGMSDVDVPGRVSTIGTVGGLVLLALYALSLLFSIQRMRQRKIAFWVPLVAGVIAFIATFVFFWLGLGAIPGLMERMQDPTALQDILDRAAQLRQ